MLPLLLRMSDQKRHSGSLTLALKEPVSDSLRPTDQTVLKYLSELTLNGGGECCTASIPKIASACCISERQVQISTKRLIDVELLERIGYDFSNPDRSKRGSIYKVLLKRDKSQQTTKHNGRRRTIKFLLFWSED